VFLEGQTWPLYKVVDPSAPHKFYGPPPYAPWHDRNQILHGDLTRWDENFCRVEHACPGKNWCNM